MHAHVLALLRLAGSAVVPHGTIVRVRVERVPARTRPPEVLWLWWAGPAGCKLDLDLAWRPTVAGST
jgi:hypothetical protein